MEKKPPNSTHSSGRRLIDIEPLYDAKELALQCKVSAKSLHRWAREGKIPAIKFGKLWRFRKSAIETWLNSQIAS